MSKETLKQLLEFLNKQTGKSPTDVASEMGYKKNYISEMLTPKGKVSDKFLNSFKIRYQNILENRKNDTRNWNEDDDVPPRVFNEDEHVWGNSKKDLENEYLKKRIEDLERLIEAKDLIITTLKNDPSPLKKAKAG